jgi:transcriptional regulator with XRE-family HTH domain
MPSTEDEMGLRQLRVSQCKTLTKVAEQMGVPIPNLHEIEMGRRKLAGYVTRLLPVLGVEVCHIADREEDDELTAAMFRSAFLKAIYTVARGARDIWGGWTETDAALSTEQAWLDHQLSVDWETKLTVAKVTAAIGEWPLSDDQRAEIEQAVAERREIEKARQEALRVWAAGRSPDNKAVSR